MRYFIHLGYDGASYHGWQRQKNTERTVQEVIEKSLFKVLKKEIIVYGCGRTDTGVHASQYIMHINLEQPPEFNLKFRLNKNLPDDIAVFEIIEVKGNKHARYDATARTYDYFIHWGKDPVLYGHSTYYEQGALNFELMKKVAALYLKTKDFRAVCKRPDFHNSTICEITNCEIIVNEEEGRLRFSITSNRFLKGMIRYCVYFLLKVGSGRMSISDFEKILKQQNTDFKKKPALPNGLFMSKVEYSFISFKEQHRMIKMLKVGLE